MQCLLPELHAVLFLSAWGIFGAGGKTVKPWRASFLQLPAGQFYSLLVTVMHRGLYLNLHNGTRGWLDFWPYTYIYLYTHGCGDVGFFRISDHDCQHKCGHHANLLWNKRQLRGVTFWSWRVLSSLGLDLDIRPEALTVQSLKLRISVRWARCFSLCLLQSVNTFLNQWEMSMTEKRKAIIFY